MPSPFITVLSCSFGCQSGCLLEQVLEGEIEKPFRFLVLCADPGKEDKRTYYYARQMRARCKESGIDVITAPGPNLYNDILNTQHNGETRMDNPPFWVKNADGSRGKLIQGCTGFYKVAPMRKALRRYLRQKYSVGNKELRSGLVEMWIGFAADEWHRCSESNVQYIDFRFPLIEQKMTKANFIIDKGPRKVWAAMNCSLVHFFKLEFVLEVKAIYTAHIEVIIPLSGGLI